MSNLELVQNNENSWFDGFIEWVGGTNLFRLIRDNPNADRIEGLSDNETFVLHQLKGIRRIKEPMDLPFPILLHFCRHYNKVPEKIEVDKNTVKAKILKVIMDEGATVEDFIDVVIEGNAIIGVGLITLGDKLKDYCYNKIK
jgi:hypothetical protein